MKIKDIQHKDKILCSQIDQQKNKFELDKQLN